MSESLRDMFVGIHFNDEASRDIDKVDRSMDNVEETTKRFGLQLGFAENNIDNLGTAGIVATKSIEKGVDDVNDNVIDLSQYLNRAGRAGINAGVAMSAALEKVEDDAEDAADEVNDLGNAFVGVGIKAAAIGLAITAASSAGIAAIAPLVMAIGGIASSLVVAGAGAVAFGAVTVSALGQVFEASEEVAKLEEKIANADTAKERIKAQKELAAFYEGMSEEQQSALESLQSFKTFWGDFVQQFEKPIFDTFAVGLQATQTILDRLEPTISGVSNVVGEMMNSFNNSLGSEGATKFFNWLEKNAASSLKSFAQIGANTFSGLFGMLQAFSPISSSMEKGLVGLTAQFKEWGNSLGESQGFQNFISYAKENGPVLMSTLGNIGTIFKNLTSDLAPFGSTVLSGLQSFTSLIIDNWGTLKALVIGVGAGFATFKVISTVVNLMSMYQASTFASTVATQGFNAALRANPIGLIVTAVGLLVTAGIMLYQNWDTVKEKAVQLWGIIRSNPITAFLTQPIQNAIDFGVKLYQNWDTIKASAIALWTVTKEKFVGIKDAISSAVQPIIGWFSSLNDKWNAFKSAISNFKLPSWVSSIGSKIGGGVFKGFFDGSHATGLANVPFDGYRAELHKNEAVLTAQQSNALRSAGILRENADGTPDLNIDTKPNGPQPDDFPYPNIPQPADDNPYPQQVSTDNSKASKNYTFHITVQATSDKAQDIADTVREVISDMLDSELQTT